ncbi:hypothetical protein l11_09640 [Neisseria weaveri LMG 5135]|nr:hypothetical protein l11_09640 [Neisseria weaveri LMG 5135]
MFKRQEYISFNVGAEDFRRPHGRPSEKNRVSVLAFYCIDIRLLN